MSETQQGFNTPPACACELAPFKFQETFLRSTEDTEAEADPEIYVFLVVPLANTALWANKAGVPDSIQNN